MNSIELENKRTRVLTTNENLDELSKEVFKQIDLIETVLKKYPETPARNDAIAALHLIGGSVSVTRLKELERSLKQTTLNTPNEKAPTR